MYLEAKIENGVVEYVVENFVGLREKICEHEQGEWSLGMAYESVKLVGVLGCDQDSRSAGG